MKKLIWLCWILSFGNKINAQIPNSWARITNCGGSSRGAGIGFNTDSFGYVGMGELLSDTFPHPIIYHTDLWQYDPAANLWRQKASFPGLGRESTISFTIGSKAYVGLGDRDGNPFEDIWEYDPATDIWTQKGNFGGGYRTNGFAFSIGNKGYVGLGDSSSDYGSYKKDIWEYDPSVDGWTRKADFPGLSRANCYSFNNGNSGYISSGYNGLTNGVHYLNDVWQYNPDLDNWTQRSSYPGKARGGTFTFTIGDRAYVGCGADSNYIYHNDFWQYNPLIDEWTQKDSFGGGIRVSGVAFTIGESGYAGTGDTSSIANSSKDFWRYIPDSILTSIKTISSSVLTISPNPATNKLYIQTALSNFTITLSDMTGRSWPVQSSKEIDVSTLAAGVYCLQLQSADGVAVRRFVKE